MVLSNDKQFQMRVSDEFLQRLDDWRRSQPDLPPRAEAIRRLVEIAMQKGPWGPSQEGDHVADVHRAPVGFGFNILNKGRRPLVTIEYQSEADAQTGRDAAALAIAKSIKVAPHGR